MMDEKRLTRSTNKIIAGVCGGIADYLGWSPTTVRVLYVAVSVLSAGFPGILVYILLALVMPRPDQERRRFNVHHPGER